MRHGRARDFDLVLLSFREMDHQKGPPHTACCLIAMGGSKGLGWKMGGNRNGNGKWIWKWQMEMESDFLITSVVLDLAFFLSFI